MYYGADDSRPPMLAGMNHNWFMAMLPAIIWDLAIFENA